MNLTRRYPYSTHLLEDILKSVCGEHGGIAKSLLASPLKYAEGLKIKSIVANMPNYHKVLLNPELDMQYHLSGYGLYYEEALIRLAGEAIERYSLMVAQYTLGERLQYASYREISKRGTVIPFEYLNLFSESDYIKLNKSDYKGIKKLELDDIVGWVKCHSLIDPEHEIWVPAQMLLVGYRMNRDKNEVAFSPGFSTGTAAHSSVTKALQNAILEFIEIDALMLNWYTKRKAPAVIMDNLTISSMFPELFCNDSRYDAIAVDLRVLDSVDAAVLGAILINKKHQRPLIVFGAQASLDPVHAYYRGLMESIAIAFLGIYGPLYLPEQYFTNSKNEAFTDLDRNVSFYASPEYAEIKLKIIQDLIGKPTALSGMPNYQSDDVKKDTVKLIRQVSSVSEFAVFLDITPPETSAKGWHVMRTFIPELVTMCVPGVPYSNHPRIKASGGISNEYPHPLP
ncbi:Streptolysin S biosynthesis protein D (SagD) [hydrothermal vent metagenome]|uniref:Streptolysin S biosynthesis protein D (SagD) n=2 Tax=hydrothermal vent metagenome TaxID=652676 RepID=A0A3B1AB33_9ZZZZ